MHLTMLATLRQGTAAFALGVALAIPVAFAQPAQPAAPAQAVAPAQPATPAQAAATTPASDAAAVKKRLEERFPGAEIRYVAKSGYFGLYEALLGDQMVYTDAKANQILVGSIFDVASKQNLTEMRMRKLNRVAVDKLPMDLAFVKVKGNGSRKLIVFSDADCPFCHRLESELKDLDNVTIYTFLYPIDQLHPDAARKSKQIWCSADKVKAWDDFFATGKVPDNAGDCGDPVERNQALGNSLKINATPTLIFADGSMFPGALPLAQIEKELANADIEMKKVAAAPK